MNTVSQHVSMQILTNLTLTLNSFSCTDFIFGFEADFGSSEIDLSVYASSYSNCHCQFIFLKLGK